MTEKCRAVFLDRDGTIIKEVHYLDRIEDIELLPGVAQAISALNAEGFKVIVVTNQSGIARGFFDEEFVRKSHGIIDEMLSAQGATVDAWYYCPHHPSAGQGPFSIVCTCRKPAIGMFVKAANDFGIDLSRSFMIGDSIGDVKAGWNAGLKSILVLTGHGRRALDELIDGDKQPDLIAADIQEAVEWILHFSERILPEEY